ncbi:ribonuclease H-like domain-containing protein [Cantharellus anzutake]|uniref:ribonuclease H-like domain-containing protein n=1 Tax=Cantharellus anzutake TaxID=1750568 RepID=UPI001907808A|nr:ribonuclease H-like domain-containing protein [Cantharellus anzutake]KAF8340351.1 ribonuclease H-like domain-containing protein [Cantharellus anzutake]
MSKTSYYAVKVGKTPGVYLTCFSVAIRKDCEEQTKGWPNARYKKFSTRDQADDFIGISGATDSDSLSAIVSPSPAPLGIPNPILTEPESAHEEVTENNEVVEAPIMETPGTPESRWTTVYTDGACKGNGQEGSTAGIGVWWGAGDPRNLSERCPGAQTNNRAELIALIRALETTPLEQKLLVRTDSEYSIKCVTDWLPGWRKKGFRNAKGNKIANLDIILYLEALVERKLPGTIRFEWVEGHSGNVGNDAADRLATEGTLLPWRPEKEEEWDVAKLEQKQIPVPEAEKTDEMEAIMEFSAEDLLSDEEIRNMVLTDDF